MNGKLVYECDECDYTSDVFVDEVETFTDDNGLLIRFTSECEGCGEPIKIELTVKDD